MKIRIKRSLNHVSLELDTTTLYQEDYQLAMLSKNHIDGLLPLRCLHLEEQTRFIYEVGNRISMKNYFKQEELSAQAIYHFLSSLLDTLELLQDYMLIADGLILHPNYIFKGNHGKEESWQFLYQPNRKYALHKSFHELTEYFVQALDYQEQEGILLAYQLHKETMKDCFELPVLIARIKEQYESEQSLEISERSLKNKDVFRKRHNQSDNQEENLTAPDTTMVQESTGFAPFSNLGNKIRRSRWGAWHDLIISD